MKKLEEVIRGIIRGIDGGVVGRQIDNYQVNLIIKALTDKFYILEKDGAEERITEYLIPLFQRLKQTDVFSRDIAQAIIKLLEGER